MKKLYLLIVGALTFAFSFGYYTFHFYTHVIKYQHTDFVLTLQHNPVRAFLFFTGLAFETAVLTTLLCATILYYVDKQKRRKEQWENLPN